MQGEAGIWHQLFEQTPPLLRWVLGALTLGVFTLATYLYRREQRKNELEDARIEAQLRRHIERVDQRINERMSRHEKRMEVRFDELNANLRILFQEHSPRK